MLKPNVRNRTILQQLLQITARKFWHTSHQHPVKPLSMKLGRHNQLPDLSAFG
jgi:hypothetical protein